MKLTAFFLVLLGFSPSGIAYSDDCNRATIGDVTFGIAKSSFKLPIDKIIVQPTEKSEDPSGDLSNKFVASVKQEKTKLGELVFSTDGSPKAVVDPGSYHRSQLQQRCEIRHSLEICTR